MLTVHHLKISQSERIVWLCEELGIQYELVNYKRREDNQLSPESLANIPGNDLTAAPIIQDGNVTLAETGAIAEYILTKYGKGKLILPPDHKDYDRYLYWFWFGCSNIMPSTTLELVRRVGGITDDSQLGGMFKWRFERLLKHLDSRCKETKWLAGDDFTAADCMVLFCVTSHRYFVPFDLEPYPNMIRWIGDCAKREGYKRTMEKCDPELDLALDVKGPQKSLFG